MNILILPSWWPHRCFPHEGLYVRDQAMALAELRPDWNVGLALWHQGRNLLTPAHALHAPRCVLDALFDRATRVEELRPNLVAWTHPALQTSERVRQGNRAAVLAAARACARDMRARWGHIDLLHAHAAYPAGWAAMHLSQELGIPYVITEHMGPFPLPVYARADGALPEWIRAPHARAAARIAVSRALADDFERRGLPRPDLVPNVVDERRIAADRTSDPAWFTFFTLCHMVRTKGVLDLLEAAARLLPRLAPAERARVRWRIAGTGPDLPAFRAAGTRLGLDAHLEWLDRHVAREETAHGFETCDCFVLPSHHESFGIVFIEAMAAGRPSIATRCGGPETILDETTGMLVPVGDLDALAEAMAHMVRGAAKYDRAVIRAAFERRYARAAVVGAFAAIYGRVTARG